MLNNHVDPATWSPEFAENMRRGLATYEVAQRLVPLTHVDPAGEEVAHVAIHDAATGEIRCLLSGLPSHIAANLQDGEAQVACLPGITTTHAHRVVNGQLVERPTMAPLPLTWPLTDVLTLDLARGARITIDGRFVGQADDQPTEIPFAHAGRYHFHIRAFPFQDLIGVVDVR